MDIVKTRHKPHASFSRMDETTYTNDGKFEGNILIVRRTGCGKTMFVPNLGKSKLFGDIKEVFWISKIELSRDREANIRDRFTDQVVNLTIQTMLMNSMIY